MTAPLWRRAVAGGRRLVVRLAGRGAGLVDRGRTARRWVAHRVTAALGRTDGSVAATAALSLAAAVAVYFVAMDLFPYHSVNHDEGVYLQQAAMLLEGTLDLRAGSLADAVRPWFFVRDGGRLYPKYSPVPATVFAAGEWLVGEYRVALAAVAAGNVALVVALGTAAYDRLTGLLAGAVLLASPLFLINSATFLPYAPTTLFNLGFALAYVAAVRRDSTRYAALAGLAAGVAFFARPYTAVLFAAPFAGHAAWTLAVAARHRDRVAVRTLAVRYGALSACGMALVGVTLAYNAAVTGSAWLFPYEAFAPLDGLGFGRRRLLGQELRYTPELAVRANTHVVWYFLTRWFTAGVVGSLLAAVGAGAVLVRSAQARPPRSWLPGGHADDAAGDSSSVLDGAEDRSDHSPGVSDRPSGPSDRSSDLSDRGLRWLLLGVAAAVVLGNVYFWGNYNVLGTVGDPTDGLLAHLGPYYHFDLLVPLSVFAASGAVLVWRRARATLRGRLSRRHARIGLAACLVVAAPAAAVAEGAVLAPPVDRNAAHTEKYERAYAPFERRGLRNALVFVPTPYGDWANHPFQWFRNDPGFDGRVVYAFDRGAAGDFAVLDAYPDRSAYRYTYRGRWTPAAGTHVVPALRRLDVREGAAVRVETTVGVPSTVRHARVRLSNGDEALTYAVERERWSGAVTVRWTVTPDGLRLSGPNLTRVGGGNRTSVPLDGPTTAALSVTFVQPGGSTLAYRQEVDARPRGDAVQVVWPPRQSVCDLVADCGRTGTYLPGHPGFYAEGVSMNATASVVESRAQAGRARAVRSRSGGGTTGTAPPRRPAG